MSKRKNTFSILRESLFSLLLVISLPNGQFSNDTFYSVFFFEGLSFFYSVYICPKYYNLEHITKRNSGVSIQRMCELNCTQSVGIIVYNGYKSRNSSRIDHSIGELNVSIKFKKTAVSFYVEEACFCVFSLVYHTHFSLDYIYMYI